MKGSFSIRTFTLEEPSHCFIELTQHDKRLYRKAKFYDYSPARLILAKYNVDGEVEFVNGCFGHQKTIQLELHLTPGVYEIVACIDW